MSNQNPRVDNRRSFRPISYRAMMSVLLTCCAANGVTCSTQTSVYNQPCLKVTPPMDHYCNYLIALSLHFYTSHLPPIASEQIEGITSIRRIPATPMAGAQDPLLSLHSTFSALLLPLQEGKYGPLTPIHLALPLQREALRRLLAGLVRSGLWQMTAKCLPLRWMYRRERLGKFVYL